MKFYSLASGSSGNCFLIDNQKETILIDVGIPYKQIKDKLTSLNYEIEKIDYILITHEHVDHVKSINSFSFEKIYSGVKIKGLKNLLIKNEENSLGTYIITPFALSHDVACCGYRIQSGDESLVYLTDSGYVNYKIKPYLKDANYYVFESNHDIDMLMNSNRPYFLKARILSDNGHLNNEDASEALLEAIGDNTREIYLAHISKDCNTKELAYKELIKTFKTHNINLDNLIIKPLEREEIVVGGNLHEMDSIGV